MVYISTFLFVHYVEGKESSEHVWSILVHSCFPYILLPSLDKSKAFGKKILNNNCAFSLDQETEQLWTLRKLDNNIDP